MFRNYRKCYCMNNSYKNDSCEMQQDIIENQCDNVVSYEEYNDGCSCGFDEEYNVFPENPMLAQSYVPFQYMDEVWRALPFMIIVTLIIFWMLRLLVSPYVPCQSMEEINFIRESNEIGKGCNKCQ